MWSGRAHMARKPVVSTLKREKCLMLSHDVRTEMRNSQSRGLSPSLRRPPPPRRPPTRHSHTRARRRSARTHRGVDTPTARTRDRRTRATWRERAPHRPSAPDTPPSGAGVVLSFGRRSSHRGREHRRQRRAMTSPKIKIAWHKRTTMLAHFLALATATSQRTTPPPSPAKLIIDTDIGGGACMDVDDVAAVCIAHVQLLAS